MATGFMGNIRGTLIDLDYILGSGATSEVKDSAISIMVGELASFSAPPSQLPPDEGLVALMGNFGETLASLYTILSIETDQEVIDHSVHMVVSEFQLMDMPMDSGGGDMAFPDFGSDAGSSDLFSISTGIDDKIAYLEGHMTGTSVKDTLYTLFNYNASEDDELMANATIAINNAIMQLDNAGTSLSGLVENLYRFEDNITDPGDKALVGNFSGAFAENLTMMDGASNGMQMLGYGLGAASMMDGMIEGLAFSIPMMLSSDFDKSSGELSAEAAMIIVMLDATPLPGETDEEHGERFLGLERRIEEIVGDEEHSSTRMDVMGMHMISEEIIDASMDSMSILLPAAGILVLFILALIYHNPLDILFSVSALGFAIVWVFGLGTLMGFVFNPMTIAVPVLIVGLGIDYGIHITLRYRE